MVEVAFIVNPESELYKNYFIGKEERQRFHDIAREFFAEYDLLDSGKYHMGNTLILELSPEKYNEYANQIKKEKIDGMYVFKKNAPMQKEWLNKVVSKVDFVKFNLNDFWYWDYIKKGRYSMWDVDGILYGYLCDDDADEINLYDDEMTRIKMSEYYAAKGN